MTANRNWSDEDTEPLREAFMAKSSSYAQSLARCSNALLHPSPSSER